MTNDLEITYDLLFFWRRMLEKGERVCDGPGRFKSSINLSWSINVKVNTGGKERVRRERERERGE